ncbi:MAG: FadR/GntR family transcriptional regulator [Hyphomicrobiales bacterium]
MAGPALSDHVYEAIFSDIVTGKLPERTRLPSEVELSKTFEVSRPVVREALSRLRDDGLVASRRGSGTYVQQRPSSDVLRFTPLSSIADMQRCFEFRIGLEGEIAFLAAQRADSKAISIIHEAMQRLDEIIAGTQLGVDADFELHLAIAEAADNRYYLSALSNLRESVAVGMNLARNLSLLKPRDRMARVQNEHVEIVRAIEAGDPEEARTQMRRHIENAKSRVFEGPSALVQQSA